MEKEKNINVVLLGLYLILILIIKFLPMGESLIVEILSYLVKFIIPILIGIYYFDAISNFIAKIYERIVSDFHRPDNDSYRFYESLFDHISNNNELLLDIKKKQEKLILNQNTSTSVSVSSKSTVSNSNSSETYYVDRSDELQALSKKIDSIFLDT